MPLLKKGVAINSTNSTNSTKDFTYTFITFLTLKSSHSYLLLKMCHVSNFPPLRK